MGGMTNEDDGLVWRMSGGEWDTEGEMDGITVYGTRESAGNPQYGEYSFFEVLAYKIDDFQVFFDEHLMECKRTEETILEICRDMGWDGETDRIRFLGKIDPGFAEILVTGWIDNQYTPEDRDPFGWVDSNED